MDSGFEHDIRKFKVQFCDETQLIIDTLKRDFADFAIDPVLDVGAGFQSISEKSFPGHDITLLDKINYEGVPEQGKRITADFFDYAPDESNKPATILLCHVLQYVDDDLPALFRKIALLAPSRIISVVNENTGVFGTAVRWAKRHLPSANPEFEISMEPAGYREARRSRFRATLECGDFETLAYNFGRLILDLSVSSSRSPALRSYLQSVLDQPTMVINQSIIGYEKQG